MLALQLTDEQASEVFLYVEKLLTEQNVFLEHMLKETCHTTFLESHLPIADHIQAYMEEIDNGELENYYVSDIALLFDFLQWYIGTFSTMQYYDQLLKNIANGQ